jgi:hypothetical protein
VGLGKSVYTGFLGGVWNGNEWKGGIECLAWRRGREWVWRFVYIFYVLYIVYMKQHFNIGHSLSLGASPHRGSSGPHVLIAEHEFIK